MRSGLIFYESDNIVLAKQKKRCYNFFNKDKNIVIAVNNKQKGDLPYGNPVAGTDCTN